MESLHGLYSLSRSFEKKKTFFMARTSMFEALQRWALANLKGSGYPRTTSAAPHEEDSYMLPGDLFFHIFRVSTQSLVSWGFCESLKF